MDFEKIAAELDQAIQKRAADMPMENDALQVMFTAWQRLRELGWRDIGYCPKNGTPFLAIEARSTDIHRCYYRGKWPMGMCETEDGRDMYPILFKALLKEQP